MGYWIGIDAGGTQSTLVYVDNGLVEQQRIVNTGIHAKRDTINEQVKKVLELLKSVFEQISPESIEGICIGLAGAGRTEDQHQLQSALSLADSRFKFCVTSDAVIAHTGAFHNKNGILVITGTGSMVLGKNDSSWARAGGYGYLIGDDGSGYQIGMQGLKSVGIMFDGGDTTALLEIIRQNFGVNNRDEFIQFVYNNDFQPSLIAPFVLQAAENEDAVCRSILLKNTNELATQVLLVQKSLNLQAPALILTGGLQKKLFYQKMLQEAIFQIIPEVRWQMPSLDAAAGACLYMMKQTGSE